MSGIVDDLLGWVECEEENTVVGAVGSRVELAQRVGAMTVLMSLAASEIQALRKQIEVLKKPPPTAGDQLDPRVEISERNLKRAASRIGKVQEMHVWFPSTNTCKECDTFWPCETSKVLRD